MIDLNKIYLFRMTHIENIPHILENGITHSKSLNANPKYKPIGDRSIITIRNRKRLNNGKTLGDYVPFYFAKRTPMLYVIQKGFNGLPITQPENIVYCITSVGEIINNNVEFLFTNGHAVDELSDFYDEKHISEIDNIIDKQAIEARFWNNEQNTDLKRRKEAEFLIGKDLPFKAIKGFAVYNESSKQKLEKLGISEQLVVVKENFYF